MKKFVFVGYDIREKYWLSPSNYFLGSTKVITFDDSLLDRYDNEYHFYMRKHPVCFYPLFRDFYTKFKNLLLENDKKQFTPYAFEIYAKDVSLVLQTVLKKDESFSYEYPLYQWAIDDPVEFEYKEKFECVGYDVCDMHGLSGVANCGYKKEELEIYGKLNEWSLYSDLESAKKFRRFVDKGAEEHTPFVIWKIWRLKEGEVLNDVQVNLR